MPGSTNWGRPEHSWRWIVVEKTTKQTRTYRSEIAASVHEMMEGVYDAGLIDKQTMREFDESCPSPALPIAPKEIKAIREREHVSQPVFARYLNVLKNLVSD
jgi:putative transcriptional regulator